MEMQDGFTYEVSDDDPNKENPKITVTQKVYKFPFGEYVKTTTFDHDTKKKNVTKTKNFNLDTESVLKTGFIVGVVASSVNLVANGISHLINAIKRK